MMAIHRISVQLDSPRDVVCMYIQTTPYVCISRAKWTLGKCSCENSGNPKR